MKFICFLVVLQLVSLENISAQNLPDSLSLYHNKINSGFWDLYNKNNQKGIEKVEEAFKCTNAKPQDIKTYLHLLKNVPNTDSLVIHWASFGVKKYGMRLVDLFDELNIDYYDSILNYKKLYCDFLSSQFDNRRDMFYMEHYFFNDTYFRINLIQYKLSNGTELGAEAIDLATQYDTLVVRPFIKSMIDKYNFPTAQDVGYANIQLFYFVLRHHNISDNILHNALLSGKLHPRDYASLIDYSHTKKKITNRMYGPALTKKNGEFLLDKMEDYLDVDKRRLLIGLLPIYQDSKISDPPYKLNPEYIEYLGRQ